MIMKYPKDNTITKSSIEENERSPELQELNSSEDESGSESDYDSNVDDQISSNGDDDDESEEEFEDQGSSDEDDNINSKEDESEDEMETIELVESIPRKWKDTNSKKRSVNGTKSDINNNDPEVSKYLHTDDLSSDDEDDDGNQNRIGRIPLHWYDEYDHIGYDGHGKKIIKSNKDGDGDLLDQIIEQNDPNKSKKLTVYDALNAKEVEITDRHLELIRRIQAGAYAHPEFDANPDYIDYFSGVNHEISGINSNKYEPKSRFQPSKWEKMQVRKLLHRLKCGSINMDYLTGKVKDMNPDSNLNKPFLLWKGDEEDELNLRKGPQHIAAPKVPPPGHAESYNPSEEYLPTQQDLEQWKDMDVQDRPYGLLIPQKFKSLRAVGAYEHSVRERFERCLDLYLCPRVMKRRLNIDP